MKAGKSKYHHNCCLTGFQIIFTRTLRLMLPALGANAADGKFPLLFISIMIDNIFRTKTVLLPIDNLIGTPVKSGV